MASYKHFYSLLFASAAAFSLCTSCVDDAYDLSDMDTTVGLNVNELTIPLNVKEVTLDKILDFESEQIKKRIVGGKNIYVFEEEDDFESSKEINFNGLGIVGGNTVITGEIPEYTIEGFEIAKINIAKLPDVLSQDGTSIVLCNPQLYITANNPLGASHIKANTKVELVAKRSGETDRNAVSDLIEIVDETSTYCMAPSTEIPLYEKFEGYDGAIPVKFNGLVDIFSGDRFPEEIRFNMQDIDIPRQPVENFDISKNYGKFTGRYHFFAPIALGEGSVIYYKETLDGWMDETLEKLDISKAGVKADVKSDIPLKITLTVSPIDEEGNIINNIESEPVEINATRESQPIDVVFEGNIRGLDGIILDAKIEGADGRPISPEDKIKFDNFKVTVSGKYIDEF